MDAIRFFNQHQQLSPQALLTCLKETELTQLEEFLYFDNFNQTVLKNANFLKSSTTLAPDTLEDIFNAGGITLARSIDGDFLLAVSKEETWVLPTSLNLADIEKFSLSPQAFLIAWLQHNSPSRFLN